MNSWLVALPVSSSVVAISALFAYTGVLLVFQIGQPRIWYSMSKDGLLPTIFSSIHEKYATPWFATIVAGLLVGIPSMFMNLVEVTDLTSIGTLFAFGMVCLGILESEQNQVLKNAKFKVPYFNSLYFNPVFLLLLPKKLFYYSLLDQKYHTCLFIFFRINIIDQPNNLF